MNMRIGLVSIGLTAVEGLDDYDRIPLLKRVGVIAPFGHNLIVDGHGYALSLDVAQLQRLGECSAGRQLNGCVIDFYIHFLSFKNFM